MDRYGLTIKSKDDPTITVEGPWVVIAATLQALTKWEYSLRDVVSIEVNRV